MPPLLLLLLPLLLPYVLAVFAGPPPVHATAQWRLSAGHKGLDLLICRAQRISQHFQLLLLLLRNDVLLLLLNGICCLSYDRWLLLNRRFRRLGLGLRLLIFWLMFAVPSRAPHLYYSKELAPCSILLSPDLGSRVPVDALSWLCCFPCLIPWLLEVYLMVGFSINTGIYKRSMFPNS